MFYDLFVERIDGSFDFSSEVLGPTDSLCSISLRDGWLFALGYPFPDLVVCFYGPFNSASEHS